MYLQTLFILLITSALGLGFNIPRQASTAPDPHQPNIIPTCTSYYRVAQGDTCYALTIRNNNFTLSDFYTWNPDVGTDCSNLLLNVYVCIAAPKPTTTSSSSSLGPSPTCPSVPAPPQPGMIGCCKTFYKVVDGDSCVAVENRFKISDANFRKWNTGIDSNCFNLLMGYYVCVGV